MRIIAGKTPGWENTEVYVDGVKIDYVFEADDVLGKVYKNIRLPDGSFATDYTGDLAYEVVTGHVEFRTRKEKPAPVSAAENMQNNVRGDKVQAINSLQMKFSHTNGIVYGLRKLDTPIALKAGDIIILTVELDEDFKLSEIGFF